MSELQEKREYYDDRSLKAVYSVDEQGRKQGEAITYAQNSDKIIQKENYVDGLLDGKFEDLRWNIIKEAIYKKGVRVYSRSGNREEIYDDKGDIQTVKIDGKIVQVYKDKKVWDGIISEHEVHNYNRDEHGYYSKSGTIKEGKMEGAYTEELDDDKYGYYKIKANYKNGVLDGVYESEGKHLVDLKLYNGSVPSKITGEFHDGMFTGHLYLDRKGINTVTTVDKGQITYEIENYREGKSIERFFKNGEICRVEQKGFENLTKVIEKDRAKTEVRYRDGTLIEKYEEKNDKKDGFYQKFNSKGWMEIEAQYKEDKLHGVYKELNSDGTVHAQKYYENGVDVTEKRKALKKIAERRIAKEEKLSAKKGESVILKKMNKLQKALALKKAQKESER